MRPVPDITSPLPPPGRCHPPASSIHVARSALAAFTLIELLMVVAIMGIVMTMAVPAIYRQLHPDSMQKAVEDITEACAFARAQAILSDTPMEVRIRPPEGTITVARAARATTASALFSPSVSGKAWRMEDRAAAGGDLSSPLFSPSVSGEDWRMSGRSAGSGGGGSGGSFSARLSDRIKIVVLGVNFIEYQEEEVAQVRFFPNGTSDEFALVLTNDKGEWRLITLEVVTGLPEVETDVNKIRQWGL